MVKAIKNARVMNSNKIKFTALAFILIIAFNACDRTSSPEGRMSIKLEQLQKEMRDSLKTQKAAILDTLSKIREDIQRLEQNRK